MYGLKNTETVEGYHLPIAPVGGNVWVIACQRCAGDGHSYFWQNRDNDGVCFLCRGTGMSSTRGTKDEIVAIALRRAKANAAARAREEAKREAAWLAGAAEREAKAAADALAKAEREAAEAAAREAVTYHPAAVDDKIEFTGTVLIAINIEGIYGTQRLLVVNGNDGHQYKMMTTAGWAFSTSRDEQVALRAVVKGFAEYDGYKQTVVKRPTLVA